MIVAGDRALTRFVTESLLGGPLDEHAQIRNAHWDIARAHSGLEAHLLLTQSGAPFDVALIDQGLPDQDLLELIGKFRLAPEGLNLVIFVMTERGRDPHFRRVASEDFGVAGFIEKPVTANSLRDSLQTTDQKKRVLLVDSDVAKRQGYAQVLTAAGYRVDTVGKGAEALAPADLWPEIVLISLDLEDRRGIDICIELKKNRNRPPTPVVLYGHVSSLPGEEVSDNAHRADDFIQAPFDDATLVERVAALIGRGTSSLPPPPPKPTPKAPEPVEPASPVRRPPAVTETDPIGLKRPDLGSGSLPRQALMEHTPAPPRSASPAPVGPTHRSTRRVPCNISMSIRNAGRVYNSKTLDISHGGIFLATEETMDIGTVIDMCFQLPDTKRTVRAVGKVVWVRRVGGGGGMAGVGVKFSRIEPNDLQLIVDYVNRVSRVLYSSN